MNKPEPHKVSLYGGKSFVVNPQAGYDTLPEEAVPAMMRRAAGQVLNNTLRWNEGHKRLSPGQRAEAEAIIERALAELSALFERGAA